MPPAISVVIPLYNKRDYVERCLRSVRGQTFSDYQLIVVNDGSTDGSEALVEPFLRDGDTLINQDNAGVSQARNSGFETARGELIALLDADDEWLPGHLADLHSLSHRFPEAGLLGTGIRILRRYLVVERYVDGGQPRIVNYFATSARVGNVCNSSSAAIRKKVFDQLGGMRRNEPVGEDLEYWARVALRWPVALHPVISSVIRQGPSVSRARSLTSGRVGSELACDTLCQALQTDSVSAELAPHVWEYVTACRLRRVRFLVRSGLVRSALDELAYAGEWETAVAHLPLPLRAFRAVARLLPDCSPAARAVGRLLLFAEISPATLVVALAGIPQKKGDAVLRLRVAFSRDE